MTRSKGTLAAVIVAVLVALGVVVFAYNDDATGRPVAEINGDMLGMDPEESFGEYQRRAAESLAAAPAGEEVFGLITFTEPLASPEADRVTDGLRRVNAMIIGMSAPYGLPEPTAGETRTDVFDRQFSRIADSLEGVGDVPVPERMTAVIAYDDGEALRSVAEDADVAAVETLPPDAAWGRFGVRPVQVPGVDPAELVGR
ncbi:hypothetical protein B841_08695 [Corynebacterium maris DSM 45190]|uniref:Uncharacterized protein n=1 Tax=Corynebacterium maris DSM 45190 TaxID=1224163 RepID=S5SVW5_9CORY|nr:hypothetical protein [Corynebacterium maris]AGS35212.1 hypothetical protein B841_08695 [Corynebacterium maris DSM 45190]